MLVTQVFQAEGFVAARGWKVIYRSLNPEVARFLPDNRVNINEDDRARISEEGRVAETTVDADGGPPTASEHKRQRQCSRHRNGSRATSSTIGEDGGPSTGQWTNRGHLERPQTDDSSGWSELGVPKQLLTYNASLTNVGDLPAENVELNVDIPVGMNIQSVEPDDPIAPSKRLSVSLGKSAPCHRDKGSMFPSGWFPKGMATST